MDAISSTGCALRLVAYWGGPRMSKLVKSNVIDLETYAAVYAVISGYSAYDIISTAVAVFEIRQKVPECLSNDEELVGLLLHAISGQNIAVSFDHRVEPISRPIAPSAASFAEGLR
jgi:hypothetical protein